MTTVARAVMFGSARRIGSEPSAPIRFVQIPFLCVRFDQGGVDLARTDHRKPASVLPRDAL
jgi:hypothetical protein